MKIVEKTLTEGLEKAWEPFYYDEVPCTTAEDYQCRIKKLLSMRQAEKYTCLIIYGDREHFSNIHYFTGFDVRFEEALLVLRDGKRPILITGHEGTDYASVIPYDITIIPFLSFGLMGQYGGKNRDIKEILHACDLPQNGKIGLIGWKAYGESFGKNFITDVPHYIVEALVSLVGKDRLCNATDLLQDCTYGLKHSVSAKEAVQFEILGTKVSRSVFRCLKNLKPGVSEIHASEALTLDGDPLATHPNVNFGDQRVALGIASPTYHNTLAYGELVSVGYGLRGSLVHRSGFYARDISDIPSDRRAYMDALVKPYFSSIVCWYEMLHIGTNCGKIWRAVNDCIDMEKYSIKLNPGHLTHTDEWTNSPFSRESSVCIMSGMVLQCDYTASLTNPYLACHEEDGLLIADACLQQKIEELSPACWKRIQRRRKLMTELLNIDLPAEVLPLSDLSGIFFPYLANLQTILVKA